MGSPESPSFGDSLHVRTGTGQGRRWGNPLMGGWWGLQFSKLGSGHPASLGGEGSQLARGLEARSTGRRLRTPQGCLEKVSPPWHPERARIRQCLQSLVSALLVRGG